MDTKAHDVCDGKTVNSCVCVFYVEVIFVHGLHIKYNLADSTKNLKHWFPYLKTFSITESYLLKPAYWVFNNIDVL